VASLPTASSFWARAVQDCQSLELDDFDVEDDADDDELDDSDEDFEELESEPDEFLSLDDDVSDEVLDDPFSPDLAESPDLPASPDLAESSDLPESPDDLPAAADFCRLSVLKNPEPLKLTPTGWNTFFTAITSPDSGCANSDSVSSVNDC
jgi:hypothetical protein